MFTIQWGRTIDGGTGPITPNQSEATSNNESGESNSDYIEDESGDSETGAGFETPSGLGSSTSQSQINPTSPTNSSSGSSSEQIQPRRSIRQPIPPIKFNDYELMSCEEDLSMNSDVPRNHVEAIPKSEWLKAMKDEFGSIEKNKVWKLVDCPHNVKPIGLKWLYKAKRNPDGSIYKHKARLVAKGYVQIPGIDFDEVFAPVARIETIRFLIAFATAKGWEIHHLDVKTAFLYSELEEEDFVTQPPGFENVKQPNKVCKLSKALYGLRQSPRAWNVKLDSELKNMKFKRCTKEQAVYRQTDGSSLLLLEVYVDDLFVTGTSINLINKFKKDMAERFEMADLGKLNYYLGIEVSQGQSSVQIKQESYARKVLKASGMIDCNPIAIPMDPNVKYSKAEDEPEADATNYRKLVGCLRYLTQTRPDLAYSVGIVSRYMQSPRQSHAAIIKQILRYVKGTVSYGIEYSCKSLEEYMAIVIVAITLTKMTEGVQRVMCFILEKHQSHGVHKSKEL